MERGKLDGKAAEGEGEEDDDVPGLLVAAEDREGGDEAQGQAETLLQWLRGLDPPLLLGNSTSGSTSCKFLRSIQ